MARTARVVIPDAAHHVIQRGNRSQDVFFADDDYRMYLHLLKEECESADTRILAYCLMRNHIHLILQPTQAQGLSVIGRAHQSYSRYINRRMNWQGHLWQGRFSSYPMDSRYCYEALRYVELNPVRANICLHPADYRWSSARQRIGTNDNFDLKVSPPTQMTIEDWEQYWQEGLAKDQVRIAFERNEASLNPLGAFPLGTPK